VINFRFHIVSITAVFLALGIGLAVGSAFLDRATVETLRDRLNNIEDERDDVRRERGELSALVERERAIDDALVESGTPRLLAGHLADVPVVMVASRGIEEEPVTETQAAVVAAGAEYGGTLWITERFVLDDESERADLAAILDVASDDPAVLLATVSSRLGNLFGSAARPGTTAGTTTGTGTGVTGPPVPEPDLIQQLRADGFLELDPPPAPPEGFTLLPERGGRFLFVSGAGAVVPDESLVLPLLRDIAGDGTVPAVVAGQATVGVTPEAEAERTAFVGAVRSDDFLRERISSVDDLERFAGHVAAILSLEDLASGLVGSYGIGDGADSILPLPPEDG
jgi:hypothetical protein